MALSILNHPHICTVTSSRGSDQTYIRHGVRGKAGRHQRFGASRWRTNHRSCRRYAAQIAGALAHATSAGVLTAT